MALVIPIDLVIRMRALSTLARVAQDCPGQAVCHKA